MERYNCIILDDERLAIDVIENFLGKTPNFDIVGTFTDPMEAFIAIKKDPVDLLFIDIQMPMLNGLEFIKAMKVKPAIIVTTAYREFAVQGFDLDILDYLVKPIPFNRFVKAIDKFLNNQKFKNTIGRPTDEFIMVRADRKFIRVNLLDILYIEGLKDYVKIVLKDQNIITKQSLGNFEKQLNSSHFIRIHKSFVVQLSKISAYTNKDIEINKIELPIGRLYRDNLLSRFKTPKN